MPKQLFKTKSLDAILSEGAAPEHQLKRALGAFDVTMLGIGAIIGAGIFATIGTAAAGDALRPGAGPALILSFVLTGIACGFAALCYAEFAAMVPISGSAYTYSYGTLGELIAWIIGWDLIIEYAVGNVAVAISWANYFKTFVAGFGISIPDWLSTDYRTAARIPGLFENAPHIFGVPIIFNILSAGIVALITIVLVIGIRESARTNTVMVLIKLVILGIFVIIGWKYVKPRNWTPFAPNGWAGIQAGAAVVFFAYIGFDAVSTVAEEVRNPKRDLPIGIIGSLIVCTVIYIGVAVHAASRTADAGASIRTYRKMGKLVCRHCRLWLRRCSHSGSPGFPARPAEDLFLHGARRSPAEKIRRSASEIQDASRDHYTYWNCGGSYLDVHQHR
jgi:APA family basic amino acid/polyamine antiporter